MRDRYTPRNRPPFFACPKGYELTERGAYDVAPRRTDLPLGKTRFGVIEYEARLTDDEIASYELDAL